METRASVTRFAMAERARRGDVERQSAAFRDVPHLREILDSLPQVVLVLNEHRQIVHVNHSLLELVGAVDARPLIGLRPGELFGCMHAADADCGCGTTEFCRECGAVQAILGSQEGRPETRECRMLLRSGGQALDLRVYARPFSVEGERFTVFSMSDISHEKRRLALERIFFHDILNTAGNVRRIATLLPGSGPEETANYTGLLLQLSEELLESISAQRELASAEQGELSVHPVALEPRAFLANLCSRYDSAEGVRVLAEGAEPGPAVVSDPVLLGRIVTNMLKNAVEASEAGDEVRAGFDARGDRIEFWVNNRCSMPREVQLQVFQRSFSTKGPGRGLGTYSMKLLAERYLGGTVRFFCSEEQGTTFRASFPVAFRDGEPG